MKLQVPARHQSPVRVSGPKSAPHFSSDKVEGDKDVEVYQDRRCYKTFAGNKERPERVPLLFFFQIGFLFFCERTVTLFLEIFCLLG